MNKKIEKEKQNFFKKIKSNLENKQRKKVEAPFKVIMCISLSSNGNKILEIYNEKQITYSIMVKGYGTAETSMLSMLGINETERDIVIGLIKTELSKNLITDLLTEFDKRNIKNTFCCMLSPSSANLEMIKLITGIGEEK